MDVSPRMAEMERMVADLQQMMKLMQGERSLSAAGGSGESGGGSVDGTGVKGVAVGSVSSDSGDECRSVGSWADEMNGSASGSDQSVSSVSMPDGSPTGHVKINFFAESDKESKGAESGFYGQYVRSADMKSFVKFLEEALSVKIKKSGLQELALARYAVGAVPSAFVNGQVRVRALAKLGDSILTMLVSEDLYLENRSSSDMQKVIGSTCSRAALTVLASGSGIAKFLVLPANVDVKTAATAGEAVEAIVGAVYRFGGLDVARKLAKYLQLVK